MLVLFFASTAFLSGRHERDTLDLAGSHCRANLRYGWRFRLRAEAVCPIRVLSTMRENVFDRINCAGRLYLCCAKTLLRPVPAARAPARLFSFCWIVHSPKVDSALSGRAWLGHTSRIRRAVKVLTQGPKIGLSTFIMVSTQSTVCAPIPRQCTSILCVDVGRATRARLRM